tara:strand:+ start:577 stop:1536 length:960 start_codon:yes stop_codon:yes gene_type:complete
MKHFFTFIFLLSSANYIQAQCTDLFFSEYVEGWSNNKALEIYNPTPNAIDLAAYSISRYSNGLTSPSTTQLEGIILPCSTFVVGLDKRDEDGVDYDAPMWDGLYTYTDSITGEEVTIYDENDDLQSKIDLFVNPDYNTGPTSLYFNGNDAVTLEILGSIFPLDLIGKVGEDPGAAWTDNDGNYWTKDHTLKRKASILMGVSENPSVFDPTLEWDSLPANTFINLGTHECDCNCTVNSNIVEYDANFSLYPNPTTQSTVKINNDVEISQITIYNALSQIMIEEKIDNLKEVEINLPSKKGVYFIVLKDSKTIKTKSVIFK